MSIFKILFIIDILIVIFILNPLVLKKDIVFITKYYIFHIMTKIFFTYIIQNMFKYVYVSNLEMYLYIK